MRFKKGLLTIAAILFIFAVTANALEESYLYGVWNWPVPEFEDGTPNFVWKNLTMKFKDIKLQGFFYLYDEYGEEVSRGNYKVKKNVLTLYYENGGKKEYSIEPVSEVKNGYRLCLMYEGAAPYFMISDKANFAATEARANNDKKNYKKALVIANSAIKIGATNGSVWFQKAFALGAIGRHSEAIEAYEMVLKLNPKDQSAKNNIDWNKKMMNKGMKQ